MADNSSWLDVSLLFWSVFLGLLVGFSVFPSEPATETDSVQATSSIVTEVKLEQ